MAEPETRSRSRLAPDVRRQQLIDVALDLFADRDPDTVTLDDVAEQAGVSRSLLYAYFRNRPGLVAAAHSQRVGELEAITVAALREVETNDEAIRLILRIWFEEADRSAKLFRFLWGEAVRRENPAMEDWRRAMSPVFARTYGRGPEAELLSSSFAGFVNAAVNDWIDTRTPSLERVVDTLATVILGGLGAIDPVRWAPTAPWRHRRR